MIKYIGDEFCNKMCHKKVAFLLLSSCFNFCCLNVVVDQVLSFFDFFLRYDGSVIFKGLHSFAKERI